MSNFAKLLDAVNKLKDNTSDAQRGKENFWSCEQDKAGSGFAVIRFLPAPTDDDLPFVKLFNHGFQGPSGKWFIENCPTTLGKECPVCEANGPLWATGRESDKDIVRKRKRKTSFISNVLVISDPKNPDNEGKVFLFKYGKKIFDKISEAMQPPEIEVSSGETTPINPFDLSEGANFKLKIRRVEGFANFDKSEFEKPSGVKVDLTQLHDLKQFTAESNFKSFDELKKKFLMATANVGGASAVKNEESTPWEEATPEVRPTKQVTVSTADETEEDDMSFFRNLANDD